MDVNSIGLPVTRPAAQPAPPSAEAKEIPGAPKYTGDSDDLSKVNTAKSELPEGVGTRVDKTA